MKTQAEKNLEAIKRLNLTDFVSACSYLKNFAEDWMPDGSLFDFSDGSKLAWELGKFVAKAN